MIRKKTIRLLWLIPLSLLAIAQTVVAQQWNPGHKIGTVAGIYNFSYSQTPSQLVEIFPAAIPNTGLTYQWWSSLSPVTGFTAIGGATASSYSPPALTSTSQNTYYYRQTTHTASGASINSNIIKITVVSVNWEDINYIREHDVITTGISTWTSVDQLAIGQKLQTTTYLDGIGRSVEKVSRETATPANPNDTWGDMVQFSQYDVYGREDKRYLPYTSTSQSGKFKTATSTEQPQYYTNVYNETFAYSKISFDNSPLNRVMNVKAPGTAWAAAAGNSAVYDINTTTDDVKKFSVDYVQGHAPVYDGAYPANSLYKLTYTDENGKQVIEFINKSGQTILKKVQLDNAPSATYTGWICTYSVYDDFGLLRFEIQPEGVKYLEANGWSFTGTNGPTVLAEQVFQYNYDEKGRTVWKKAPGAQPLNMLYDIRDRVVFMQDGNQAALATPQWTANLYDELDRTIITTLYNTNKTITQLQTDITNSVTLSTVTVTNPYYPVTDLVLNNRQPGITLYEASNSIEFVTDANGSFESAANDEFTAQINPNAVAPGYTVTTATFNNPISNADLNNAAVTTVLKYLFYDNYSFSSVKTFNATYTNLSAYSTSDPNVIPIAKSLRTTSMTTGNMTRVLGTNTFLSATHYYDERGQLIQTLGDNIKSGTDITTLQHHFDGRVLSSCSNHSAAGGGYSGYITLTKYLFDKLGRVTSVQKQFGSNAFKTISSYDYDDAGRVKTRHLDPGYTAGGNNDLESLSYSYNIHNQITGINKDYALKNPANYNKWGHFFGLYLGFDNRDNVFTNANLTGQVTGQLWNTQGDDAQRRYDYTYDNAGRLVTAAFTQKKHTGDAWSSSEMDFSVKGNSGKITYDLNGNLLNMLQRGVIPGTAAPIDIDNLTYAYAAYSNKLQSVTDQMTNTTVNGLFGDFKDGTNGGNPDYVYDNNGNLVIDLNKNAKDLGNVAGANGIKYNFLDKPEQIRIAGKGTIKIVYSADGEKLQRSFTPEPSGATITTTYINQFIYQETSGGGAATLQFINFEEGRIRVITPTSQSNGTLDALAVDGNMDLPNGKRGAYDYYIMDYLQNVRMILTEETHYAKNTCTMETSRAALEESVFGQTGGANEVATTRYSPVPSGWTGNTSTYVSRLGTNAGHNIGPNVLQKVMAGDKVTATVQYYYSTVPGGNNTNFVSTMLGNLVQAISGSSAANDLVKGAAANIGTQLNGLNDFANAVQPNGSNPGGNTPQAYLTILFFDERFNFIAAADGGVAQQQVASSVGSTGAPLGLNAVKAPKNGYAFIYVSNQSNNDVYFDDLVAGITTGNIIEENHYYAYGLKIAALSSKKSGDSYEGSLKNNYLYQGGYSEMDDDIGWNDFALRNYDPQIGRWVQQDPYQQFASPYVGMGDDPVSYTDPNGGSVIDPIAKTASTLSTTADKAITLGEVIIRSTSTTVSKVSSAINLASKISAASLLVNVVKSINILGGAVTAQQAGEGRTIHINDLGQVLIIFQGGNNSVFLHKAGTTSNDVFKQSSNLHPDAGGCLVGELGKSIDSNDFFGNLLDNHAAGAGNLSTFEWGNLVRQGEEWDLKDNPWSIFGVAWDFDQKNPKGGHTKFTFGNYNFSSAADVGNYHAGYTGTYAGIDYDWQWKGAGAAEMIKNGQWGKFLNPFTYSSPPYGDNATDYMWNTKGMDDAARKMGKKTASQYAAEKAAHAEKKVKSLKNEIRNQIGQF
jgi:RHS repeat-associated protein